jgi:tetratricopeptide (TPR) repeat protein
MALRANPYVAGNPVGDSAAFVGRADVLREVLRVLRRPQDNAVVLYGQRRVGKTSILQHLAAWLSRRGPYRLVYFDLQDKAAWPLGRVLQELARTVASALDEPDPDLGPDPETAFREGWLPATLGDLPDGCSLVLLFDEFDVLADPKAEQAAAAFFPYLRGLLTSDPRRLQFIFVIGRNVDDLDNIALSLFKGAPARRVSLLSEEDTAVLVRLSQANGTLRWPDDAVRRVEQLTHGHPFLTQQLCSCLWERAHDEEPDEPPTVTPEDVDSAVSSALEAGRNALEWLWNGLPPAERVVASALAEAGPDPITQEELEQLLRESGVRVVIRELQNAPQLLQEWDLIEPADGGYCFRVELLRRWIAEHKPLRRVQEELDHVEPIAESLYRAGLGFYRNEQFDRAISSLRQAVGLNPNHVRASQLLADILLAQGQPAEAQQLLERLCEYQPAAARPRLVQALLAQTRAVESEDELLALYERVLELDPTQREAANGRRRIWQQRGDTSLAEGDLEAALEAYRTIGLADEVAAVEREMRRRDLAVRLVELEALERERRYQEALDLARRLAEEYAGLRDWTSDLERLERQTDLADLYQRALGALQSGDRRTAQTLLAQVVSLEPEYEDATRYLHLAVTGVDVADLQAKQVVEEETVSEVEAGIGDEREQEPRRARARAEVEGEAQPRAEAAVEKKNVLDHLRLLWGRLAPPLAACLAALVEAAEHGAGGWLVSTLTWLPLFIPTLALGLGALHYTERVPFPAVYLWASLGLGLAWVLTGSLGRVDDRVAVALGAIGAWVMAFVVAFVVLGSMAFDLVVEGATRGVLGSIAVVVAFVVAGGAASGMADAVAGKMAAAVAAGVATAMTFVVAFGVVGVVVFGVVGGVASAVAVGLMGGVVGGVVCNMVAGVAKSAEAALGLSLLAHVFLLWFSLLGGWQVFQ